MDFKKIAEEINDEVIYLRRELHKRAELSFCEFKTAEFIVNYLKKSDVTIRENVAETGVLAYLDAGAKETLLLRADMDALPITEPLTNAVRSENEGVMHACGHDCHMAVMLGAAKVLSGLKDSLSKNILFVFQPGEETTGGALPMIETGILKEFNVTSALCLHVANDVPCGKVSVSSGGVMASPDDFCLKIIGKGGHGAYPHKCINPITISSHIVSGLNDISSKIVAKKVISVCSISGGNSSNVIPDDVTLLGTVRTYDETLRKEIPEMMKKMISDVCKSFGAKYELTYNFRYPPLINDDNLADKVTKISKDFLGAENVITDHEPSMAGDDFAYFAKEVPAVYFNLGSGNEKRGILEPLHSTNFDVDENCLKLGVSLICKLAISLD